MSDFDDEDFSLGEDSSDNELFSLNDNEEEEEDAIAEESDASDASDLEDLAPKQKKARVSPKKSAAKNSKPKVKSNSNSSSLPLKNTSIGPKVTTIKAKNAPPTAVKSPAAPKLKSITAENAEMAVLEYMQKTNRPYSLLNVFENMHRAIAKPSLTKLLDNLVIKQELASKTYGKAKIYYLNQNKLPTPSEEERMAVEEQIKAVTAECAALEQELKNAEATLTGITSQISDTDLDAAIKQLEEDAETLEKKAEILEKTGRAPVSPGRKDELNRKVMKYRTAWVARKRIAMDGVNQIADGMEKKPKAVLALIGLETDEDAGIKELPSI